MSGLSGFEGSVRHVHWNVICWLLELPNGLYLHPARGPGVCGFTQNVWDAQRFWTREAAEAERVALNGALGAQPTEHIFY